MDLHVKYSQFQVFAFILPGLRCAFARIPPQVRQKLGSDTTRHLPRNVNNREIAGVKKCERVPKPKRSEPVRFPAGEAAAGIGMKAASFHPSFWLTGPLARGFRIRGLHLGIPNQ